MYKCKKCGKSTEPRKTMLRVVEWKKPEYSEENKKPKKDIARELAVCPACYEEQNVVSDTV